MTQEEAAQIVSILIAAYPRVDIRDETVVIYIKCLLDLPFAAGKAAALNLIAESKFFPTISEIRQAALQVLPGKAVPAPAEAWAEVLRQMEEAFIYKKPQFSHPAITKAVQAIGWTNLCTSEKPAADRAHFMQIYETYRERAIHAAVQLPEAKTLAGYLAKKPPNGEAKDDVAGLIGDIASKLDMERVVPDEKH